MLLQAENVFAGYGDMEILHGVSIAVDQDEIVTIIGPNGAGKSTLLKAIMGYLLPHGGRVVLGGEDVTTLRPHEKVKRGVGYVSQLDNIFPSLTVEENLEMGGYLEERPTLKARMEAAFELFPRLRERRRQRAQTMSGGERQMLAMARALMTEPTMLLLDEPSAGLAPKVALEVFDRIQEIHERRQAAILIVEQDAYQSLSISDRGYVLSMGQNEFEGPADRILTNKEIKKAYLGS